MGSKKANNLLTQYRDGPIPYANSAESCELASLFNTVSFVGYEFHSEAYLHSDSHLILDEVFLLLY